MLRCPICDSIRVVVVLGVQSRAFCGRCGSRWVQEGNSQRAVQRREAPADRPA